MTIAGSQLIVNYESQVAGRTNVLVATEHEAGNMLPKDLSFLAQADAAGIVLGARTSYAHELCRLGDNLARLLRGRGAVRQNSPGGLVECGCLRRGRYG